MTARRQVHAWLLGGLLTVAGGAWPQASPRRPVVGVLLTDVANARLGVLQAFLEGLQALGYTEGRDFIVDIRSAGGNSAALAGLAADLARTNVDVIFVTGPAPIRAVLAATRTIPVVALDQETEPVRAGWARTLARPGGNLTGLFLNLPILAAKWLQLLREAAPGARRVGVLWDPTTGPLQLDAVKAAAKGLGAELSVMELGRAEDLEPVLAAGSRAGIRAVLQLSSPMISGLSKQSAETLARERLPGISAFRRFADEGGLLSYGPVRVDMYRHAASYVDKILRGAAPGELPIEQPTHFEFVVNLKTAKALGLTMGPSLLLRADEVIQ
jgi:putative tryptophan/tyrosine transport system substrate-binding protein